jgi:hypothetical protein
VHRGAFFFGFLSRKLIKSSVRSGPREEHVDANVLGPKRGPKKLGLEYSQSWSVNEKAPKIHNVFSPTNTTLNARLKMDVPPGTKVDVLAGTSALKSSDGDDARPRVFNIPSPVLKDQAIEYHVVFPVGVGKS